MQSIVVSKSFFKTESSGSNASVSKFLKKNNTNDTHVCDVYFIFHRYTGNTHYSSSPKMTILLATAGRRYVMYCKLHFRTSKVYPLGVSIGPSGHNSHGELHFRSALFYNGNLFLNLRLFNVLFDFI